MRYLLFVFLFFGSSFCLAQKQLVLGTLQDQAGKPISNANLVVYEPETDNVAAYTISDEKGFYKLLFNSKSDSLRLEITCVKYIKLTKFIKNIASHKLDFTLTTSANQLSEVIVKPEPIELKGDTINYNVKSFTDKGDRFIIDVIKKIPGIKVTETGQILFNDKPINKFYIEGKDLLEDRYSIASNNLPSDAVEQIQVLQNHQPIRLLNGLESSDRAALNIKLSKNAKFRLIGAGHVGAGMKPILNDDNLTLLKFAKNLQWINSAKYNNVGLNLDQEIGEQNFSPNLVESGGFKKDLVSLVKASVPQIDPSRYWFNNNILVDNNYLVGLNKLFDLKVNAAYEHDQLTDYADALTQIFLPKDTINIREDHAGSRQYSKIISGLILQANAEKLYLKNNLKFERLWSEAADFISPSAINQRLSNPAINLINDLSGSIKLNNNILTIGSYTNYSNLPQNLSVSPGQFQNVLNTGRPYASLTQYIQLQGFFTDNSIGYSKKSGAFYVTNKIGVIAQHQSLTNNLDTQDGNIVVRLPGAFQNVIDRNRLKVYGEFNGSVSLGQLNVTAGVKSNVASLDSHSSNGSQAASKFFFNPNLTLAYKLSSYWETNLTAFTSSNITFDGNSSYVLQDYRSLIKNDVPIRQSRTKNISYSLNYKNVIDAIYANLKASYYQTVSNIMVKTTFDSISIIKTPIIQDNPYDNFTLYGDINKYIVGLKTAIDLSIEYNRIGSQEIQQEIFTRLLSNSYLISGKLNTRLQKNIAMEYVVDWDVYETQSRTDISKNAYQPVTNIDQTLIFKYFFPKDFLARLNVANYSNSSATNKTYRYTFIDAILQKTLLKPKLDLSFTVSNIFNTNNYSTYSYDANTLYFSSYRLRGRMGVIKVSYQF